MIVFRKFLSRQGVCFSAFLCVLFFFWGVLFGQSNKENQISHNIKTLESVWLKYKSIAIEKPSTGYLSTAKKMFSVNVMDQPASEAALTSVLKKAQADYYGNDPGLDLTLGYLSNYNNSDTEDFNFNYRQRILAGVDWNLLRNGLFANRIKQEVLENEAAISELENTKKLFDKNISSGYAKMLYFFNKEKIQLLKKRKQIVEEKLDAMKNLAQLNALTQLSLVKVNQSITDIGGMMHLYKGYNDLYELKNANDTALQLMLPLVDFNFDEIFKSDNGLNNVDDSILRLKEKNIELENSWQTRWGLRASLRYNYYDLASSLTSNNFFSASVGLSIPITTGSGLLTKQKLAKSALDKAKFTKSDHELFSEQLSYYYEFRYKLMQYLNASEKINELKEMLRVERLRQQYHDAEFNPVHALDLLDQLLGMRVDMIDMKQQSYLQLLRLAACNTEVNIADYLKIVTVDSLETSFNDYFLKKSVYIWSSATGNNSPQYISEFLNKSGIDKAIVSVKQNDISGAEFNALARMLKGYNINVSILVSNNQLVNKTKAEIQTYFEAMLLKLGTQNMQVIHLDVEPHTLPDYKAYQTLYMQKFQSMIAVVKQFCVKNNLQLEVSVPLIYSADVYKKLYIDCNRVFLMCYEQPNIETLTKKINAITGDLTSKTTIALRTEDFQNINAIEKYQKALSDKTGINNFAVHDLQRLIQLEKSAAQ